MESRYLYRGKRIDNGEWIHGDLVHSVYKKGDTCVGQYGNEVGMHIVDPSTICRCTGTICRCTGRADRDKKLIYEHDVVAYLDTYSTENGQAEADCVGEVVWDEETLSFQVTNRLSAESWEVLDGECKVIGNTIDNPELLEV